ncbi:hypothetical protein [Alloprevotella tannerae]|uniref:hypothetical protein n=1 Tax=Alloprevotella tannerae TaxID=76122 RepID=UPI0028E2568B|nr:hypothetical protein [Alloprevotella tannerae]
MKGHSYAHDEKISKHNRLSLNWELPTLFIIPDRSAFRAYLILQQYIISDFPIYALLMLT